ncbi:MAG: protein kinase [Verrucomicrobia bacterium]|nr:MAG: protein kinase [Verrucomicrobiota bacterium]
MSSIPPNPPVGTPTVSAPLPPPRVPDHELLQRIGRGAYGEVWLARSVTGAFRAVKIVHRQTFDHDRPFEREFEGILKFEPVSRRHESQVDILHVGRGDDCFYYVMELADDQVTGGQINPDHYAPRTLKSEVLFRGRVPFEECVRIGLALATALENLHANGLVHRDVKPSNIIFVNGVPKLADIGLVTGVEATRSYVGTEGFAAPEGSGSPRADLYSLGKVLYELSTGKDRQEFPELPTQLRELPDREGLMELNAVIAKACRHDPKERYASAAALRTDLELLQGGKSLARLHRLQKRLRVARRLGLGGAATAVVALGLFFWQHRQTRIVSNLANEKAALSDSNQRLAAAQEEQLIRVNAANGAQRLEADDPASALPWFIEALRRVEARDSQRAEIHRLRLGTLLRYHPRLLSVVPQAGAVHSLAFSSDGRRLAAGSDNGQVQILDGESCAPFRSLIHTGAVRSVEFSRDGTRLLTACEDGFARVWSIDGTNQPLLFPHRQAVNHAAFSPDGERVLTASADKTAQVWRAADATKVGTPQGHSLPVLHATFSPDGRQIATGSGTRYGGGELNLWNEIGGRWIATPFALKAPATWTAFSPDGGRLASSCGEARFDYMASRPGLLVDAATGQVKRSLDHLDRITHVAFSPDGKRLATATMAYEVVVRDARTGEPIIPPLKHSRWVQQAVFSPDGRWIASASSDGTARVWDAATGVPVTPPLKHGGEVFCVAFDPGGRRLATAGDSGLICVWDIGHCQPALPAFWYSAGVVGAFFSPDNRLAVTYGPKRTDPQAGEFPVRDKDPISVWDARSGRLVWNFMVAGGMTFSPPVINAASDQLAVGSYDGPVQLRDLRTGELRWAPLPIKGQVAARAFSHDGQRLVTGVEHGRGVPAEVRIWSTATGEPLTANLIHPDVVRGIVFNQDDTRIATACLDGKVRLWDVATGKLIRDFPASPSEVDVVRFSRDGRRLLTADKYEKTARLWDAGTGELVFPPLRHTGIVWDASFDPAENRILTVSFDMSAAQWDARTGRRIDPPLQHRRGLNGGCYDGTGRLIATSSNDRTVRLWSAETGELLASPFLFADMTHQLELSKDGRKLITSSAEGRAQIWDLAVTDWPVTDLKRYAEALSGQSLTPDGQLKTLAAEEIAIRITELHTSRSRDFEITTDQLQQWHRRERIDSRRAHNDFAARFHAARTSLPDFE